VHQIYAPLQSALVQMQGSSVDKARGDVRWRL